MLKPDLNDLINSSARFSSKCSTVKQKKDNYNVYTVFKAGKTDLAESYFQFEKKSIHNTETFRILFEPCIYKVLALIDSFFLLGLLQTTQIYTLAALLQQHIYAKFNMVANYSDKDVFDKRDFYKMFSTHDNTNS